MAEDPKKRIKDVNEELGYLEDQLVSIADRLSGAIKDSFEDLRDEARGVAEIFDKNLTKSIKDIAKDSEKILKNTLALSKGEADIASIKKQQFESQSKQLSAQRNLNVLFNQGLISEEEKLKAEEEIEDAVKRQNILYQDQLKFAKNIQKNLGLTGTILGGLSKITKKIGLSGLDDVFAGAKQQAQLMAAKLADSDKKTGGLGSKIKVLGAGLAGLGKGLKEMFAPEILIGGVIAGLSKLFNMVKSGYNKGKIAAERISSENVGIARSLGLAQKEASKLGASVAGFGPTVAASKQSAVALYEAMGTTEKLSSNTLKVFVKLNTFAGMSADALAEFQTFAKIAGKEAGTMVTNMAQVALQTIKSNKLAISQKKLLEATSKVSNTIRLQFKDNPKELVKAVGQSKKLGLELSKVEDIASGLLDIENSLAAEMEAELLLGRDLNLDKAREAALNNDNVTLMKELKEQTGGIAEFNKLNRVQQDAFAKSVGLSRSELANMLVEQEKNTAAQGNLVEGQQDGMKALMSNVSEAEKNAEIARRREEASIAFYNDLAPTIQKLSDIFTEIKGTLTGLFSDLVLKPLVDWATGPAGEAFLASLPDRAKKFAENVKTAADSAKEVIKKVGGFLQENPWISAAVGVGTAGIFKAISALGALKGMTPATALWVRMAGAGGSPGRTKSRNPKPRSNKPIRDPKTGRFRDPKTGKFVKAPKPKGNFFSRAFQSVKKGVSRAGSFVKKGVSRAGSAIKSVANKVNPLKVLKSGIVSKAGKFIGKAVKGGLIGTLFNIGSLAAILAGGGTPLEKAKQIIPLAASALGGALGSVAGSVIPVVGTLGGGFLGGYLGDLLGSSTAVQNALAPPLAKALGGDDVAEDFIMQGGKIQKFRKDDVVIGGTNLGGDNTQIIELLEKLITAVESGGNVFLDGDKVGNTLAVSTYRMQ